MRFNKNDRIGTYVVTFPHRQGAYAETYRVKDPSDTLRYLKLIKCARLSRHQIDDDGHVIEVEISKLLRHHNLCRFIDSSSTIIDGVRHVWFVNDFISGETLSQRIMRQGGISVYDIKVIAKSVLAALSFIHSLPTPVVHCEVTLQNVFLNLLGGFQDLKLIDFGHARFIGQELYKPDVNEVNPFYLAPECFSGVYSPQSDLYSVGVLMYHLLYGELPWYVDTSRFGGSDVVGRVLAERNKDLSLTKVDKFDFDDSLLDVIAKALSNDVHERFQTAEEFILAIDGGVDVPCRSERRRSMSSPQADCAAAPPRAKLPGQGFAAIAGMDELKRLLTEQVIDPLHNPAEYRRYGVSIPNGMLLYGPPGCGKTFFAKHFAEEVGFNFVCITPASLKSRYVNATQENIAKMFKEAEQKAPTVIFIDEINELVPDRDGVDVHEMYKSAVNEMLAQMDRTGEKGIFVIGATNYPNKIDPAILRAGRLDKKYYVGVPDMEARMALFKFFLEKRPYDFGLDYGEMAALTQNYVSADIQLIVNDAARAALRQRSKITMDILKSAISATRPSLSPDELRKYERIRASLEARVAIPPAAPRRPIGF